MKCYIHSEGEAVAICVHCGRALCSKCATPSQSGRLVCSPACAAASMQAEEFLTSTRHKSVHAARVNGYMCYGLGAVMIISAIAFQSQMHSWPLTAFVGVAGIGFVITGGAFIRVAKRNTE